LLPTIWRAKKFDKSQGRYELFFTICIYDEKKQYRVRGRFKPEQDIT
jgi:hypothetical protein